LSVRSGIGRRHETGEGRVGPHGEDGVGVEGARKLKVGGGLSNTTSFHIPLGKRKDRWLKLKCCRQRAKSERVRKDRRVFPRFFAVARRQRPAGKAPRRKTKTQKKSKKTKAGSCFSLTGWDQVSLSIT
jgi:hypothetical protein